jgi:hypothetical protein
MDFTDLKHGTSGKGISRATTQRKSFNAFDNSKIFASLCVLCGLCEKPDLEGLSLARSLCSLEDTEDAEKTLQ